MHYTFTGKVEQLCTLCDIYSLQITRFPYLILLSLVTFQLEIDKHDGIPSVIFLRVSADRRRYKLKVNKQAFSLLIEEINNFS
jgi:hypothetical protein